MEAIQKKCLWCINYQIISDDCRLDRCKYEKAVRVRAKTSRRRRSEAFRDLLGNHVDDCNEKKLLKSCAVSKDQNIDDSYCDESYP